MKVIIHHKNSEVKSNTSKELERAISAITSVLTTNLKRNPHFAGVKKVNLTLTLCGKTKIKSLNKKYRQKDKVTDVLSFPLFDMLRSDKKVLEKNLPEMELGDLYICREMAKKQAIQFELTFEQEVIHLAVHGFLHLLGFDHEVSIKEEKIMEKFESELVGKIYKKFNVKKKNKS